jgi:hypothetical protein
MKLFAKTLTLLPIFHPKPLWPPVMAEVYQPTNIPSESTAEGPRAMAEASQPGNIPSETIAEGLQQTSCSDQDRSNKEPALQNSTVVQH